MVNKVSTKRAENGMPGTEYRRVLTSYAYNLVEKQLESYENSQVTETWEKYSFTSGGLEYDTTENSFRNNTNYLANTYLLCEKERNLNYFLKT